ncbi:hypothetical protein [Actinacidiphila rubida]|uniref:hypothetical protein n=1 Tax=Actinacidiphila rubida TaxID=310780 RepID=UPI000849C44A|nr:hypothetical protein [Actinacidiphila rubida]
MNDWLRARSGWTTLLLFWGVALAGALLGEMTSRWLLEHHPATSFTAHLPWSLGGSFFVALCGTAGTLSRRRRRHPEGAAPGR